MKTTNSTEGEGSPRVAAEVERFWRHLFGGQAGLLQVWTIKGKNKSTIRDNFFNYPKAAHQAAEWALDKAKDEGREVYFCAHLLTRAKRNGDNAAEIRTLWADEDGATSPN